MFRCFDGDKHTGPLHEILRSTWPISGQEDRALWCPVCGAIMVVSAVDGQPNPKKIPTMQFPTEEEE